MEGSLGPAGEEWARRQKRVRDAETAPQAQKTANRGKVRLSIHNAQPQMCSANKADRAKSRCESHCVEFLRHRTRLTLASVTYAGHW